MKVTLKGKRFVKYIEIDGGALMRAALEQKVNSLHDMNEKAACVWLFIRAREKCKGAIAQYISQIIKKQCEMRKRGENIEKEFVIPDYLKEAVYCVTER